MDLRLIDEADDLVSLDLLREWAKTSLRREVADVLPHGCSWASLRVALEHAGFTEWGQRAVLKSSDRDLALRRDLVATYLALPPEDVLSLVAAKLEHNRACQDIYGESTHEFERQWGWYLYCLATPNDAASVRWAGGMFGEAEHQVKTAAFPLDFIDLQVLAERLAIRIVVVQLLEPTVTLQPEDGEIKLTIRLVHHRGQWGPVLDPLPMHEEAEALMHSVVEVTGVSPPGKQYNLCTTTRRGGCTACVVAYDGDKDLYTIQVGQREYIVDRSAIARVLFNHSQISRPKQLREDWALERESGGGGTWAQNALDGVPHSSLEWHVLHEFVRREARTKLREMMQYLSGRDTGGGNIGSRFARAEARARKAVAVSSPVTAAGFGGAAWGGPAGEPAPPDGADAADCGSAAWPSPQVILAEVAAEASLPSRMKIDNLLRKEERLTIYLFSVQAYSASLPGTLPVEKGDLLRLVHAREGWAYVAHEEEHRYRTGPRAGWVPRTCIELYCALRGVPAANDECIELKIGDAVVLESPCSDGIWATGSRWGDKAGTGKFRVRDTVRLALVHLAQFVH